MHFKEKYDGLMTEEEKAQVTRIQISQLANDPSFLDDYYGQMLTRKRTSKEGAELSVKALADKENQFQAILNEARARNRPKATQLAFQGALGSVAINSLKNPKMIMQINPFTPKDAASSLGLSSRTIQRSSFKHILHSIESIYRHLIDIGELYKEWEDMSHTGTEKTVLTPDAAEKKAQWNQRYTSNIKGMWQELHHIGSSESLDVSLTVPPPPKSIAQLLSSGKGRKCIPRIVQYLPPVQLKLLMQSVLMSLTTLMATTTDPVALLSELDEYATLAVYPFVPLLSSVDLSYCMECLQKVLDEDQVSQISRSKPGLLFLTLLISRAQIIKQQQETLDEKATEWTSKLFPVFFDKYNGAFAALFPPTHIIPSIVNSKSSSIPQAIPVEDLYVWQFMAAVAMASTIDQQRVLVSELRDKIVDTVSRQGKQGTDKVNIFLHSIGLDASQLKV